MVLKKYISKLGFYSKRYQSSLTCEEILKNYYATKNTPEYKIKVGKQNINYIISGNGPHHVLLLTGTMGTARGGFHSQILGFDKEKYTLIGWDAPGYHKSYPPGPDYSDGFIEREANLAYEFMKQIGINYYSVLGYSSGTYRGMILAAKYPEVVNKLVLIGARVYATEIDLMAMRDKVFCFIYNIASRKSNSREDFYKGFIKFYKKMDAYFKKYNYDICSKYLKHIKSPTLILHGTNDVFTTEEKVNMIASEIKNSRLQIIKDGWHNFHMEYPEDVNKRIQDFLIN